MKRPPTSDCGGNDPDGIGDFKKTKMTTARDPAESVLSDENLLYELLKHVDGRTLARAACVSNLWKRAAQDDRLWELMCLKDGSRKQQQQQLRNVVLAFGGFRRLYSLHLWPLIKPPASAPACTWPCLPTPAKPSPTKFAGGKRRWGNDEMNLSLSLLSIRYFEKMSSNNRSKQT